MRILYTCRLCHEGFASWSKKDLLVHFWTSHAETQIDDEDDGQEEEGQLAQVAPPEEELDAELEAPLSEFLDSLGLGLDNV